MTWSESAAALTLAVSPTLVPTLTDGTNLTLGFATERGPAYVVQRVNSLEEAGWQALTNISGTGSPVSAYDTLATNRMRVYRVQIQ